LALLLALCMLSIGQKIRSLSNFLVAAVGGAVGGNFGSAIPDYFEPAISSWHRGTGHSCAAGAMILSANAVLSEWENYFRAKAERCKAIPTSPIQCSQGTMFVCAPPNPLEQLFSTLAELFWRFLAGLLNGVSAGYVSHLVLDAVQPRSIPLLTRGL
jgi:hypothetical protein